jgi:hypothetical protein
MQPLEAAIDIAIPEGTEFITRNMILNFQPLQFKEAGTYAFEVSVGGTTLASIPVRVIVVDQAAQA